MIDSEAADRIISAELQGWSIKQRVAFGNEFLYLLAPPETDEFPSFFKVNRLTGSFTDFAPWDEPNVKEIQKAFFEDRR